MKKKALISGITGQDGSYLTELLLEKGADPNYCTGEGVSMLHEAAVKRDVKSVQFLLNNLRFRH